MLQDLAVGGVIVDHQHAQVAYLIGFPAWALKGPQTGFA
jgi:hypothetical protein